MSISGNKGEWSELYVLVKLLSEGKLYAADSNLNRINNAYSTILSIHRKESDSVKIEYKLNNQKKQVKLYLNGDVVNIIAKDILKEYANDLFTGIVDGNKSSFEIMCANEIMKELRCTKIKAPSKDKTDITITIYDNITGIDSKVGYSIKSDLGKPPSLLNATQATNFRYSVIGLSDEDMEIINAIDTRTKIRDRITAIKNKGKMSFDSVINKTFSGNLVLIDSMMDNIISEMLLEYYGNGYVFCHEIASKIESKDLLGFHRDGIYRYKIKKFLASIALGMVPSKEWNGQDEANGGYIIVKEEGDVLAYHLYNRNSFENYLLNNTKLETASTSRHRFGSLYKDENGNMFINLNLQVRFV